MTDQEINEAVARKLGATYAGTRTSLITKKEIQLWDWHGFDVDSGWFLGPSPMADFCHKINEAWAIVDYLRKQGIDINIFVSERTVMISRQYDEILADHEEAPMAICLYFLKLRGKLKG